VDQDGVTADDIADRCEQAIAGSSRQRGRALQ
jgi:hypothetical protein